MALRWQCKDPTQTGRLIGMAFEAREKKKLAMLQERQLRVDTRLCQVTFEVLKKRGDEIGVEIGQSQTDRRVFLACDA